jgi:hypothetical protein
VAYEFIKLLNSEKMNNPLYSKIKTNLLLDSKKEDNEAPIHKLTRV